MFLLACICAIISALQRESLRKVQADRIDLRRRVRDMEQKLQQERQDRRDVNSGMQRRGMNQQLVSLLIT